jgi:guanylate kinase
MEKGKLVVISGFSGAGKGTVVKQLIERYGYSLSISATTRAPREGEVDGREYYFKSTEEFLSLVDYNGLIEWTKYVDNYYGTPRRFVEDELAAGRTVILEIEVKGANNIKEQYPDAVLIFLTTKNVATLRERLLKRGTESEEVINKRICRAADEAELMGNYDYIVVNDELETCIESVHSIIISDSFKLENSEALVEKIQTEMSDFKKSV